MTPAAIMHALRAVEPGRRTGVVRRVGPMRVEASGPLADKGDICLIHAAGAHAGIASAEVIAVNDDHIVLSPYDPDFIVSTGACVERVGGASRCPVGDAFAGRLIDSFAAPLDGGVPPLADADAPLHGAVLSPMARVDSRSMAETGIRAIDALLPIGKGQRIGIFSASGVGKTTLLRQLISQIDCDRCVICLVGERGREIEDLWSALSARKDKERFTCVAAASDRSAPMRARAVHQAMALAEHWRDRGEHVLFVLDSATRFAMALREIGLAAGAPPTLRAYPPNVFATLPRVVERCGAARKGGAITAVMTVLAETDDVDDPIAETMKALLDGHIVLSRPHAEQGRFPAIDVGRSVSRLAPSLMNAPHAAAAQRVVAMLATYEEARFLVDSGLYKPGANAKTDDAIRENAAIVGFLKQSASERAAMADTLQRLAGLAARGASYA